MTRPAQQPDLSADQPAGDMVVRGEHTLRSPILGDLVVAPGAVAWVRAPVTGDVTVQPGGRCHLLAAVAGRLLVDRGIALLGAPVAGGVSLTYGTRPDAVRRACETNPPARATPARPAVPPPGAGTT